MTDQVSSPHKQFERSPHKQRMIVPERHTPCGGIKVHALSRLVGFQVNIVETRITGELNDSNHVANQAAFDDWRITIAAQSGDIFSGALSDAFVPDAPDHLPELLLVTSKCVNGYLFEGINVFYPNMTMHFEGLRYDDDNLTYQAVTADYSFEIHPETGLLIGFSYEDSDSQNFYWERSLSTGAITRTGTLVSYYEGGSFSTWSKNLGHANSGTWQPHSWLSSGSGWPSGTVMTYGATEKAGYVTVSAPEDIRFRAEDFESYTVPAHDEKWSFEIGTGVSFPRTQGDADADVQSNLDVIDLHSLSTPIDNVVRMTIVGGVYHLLPESTQRIVSDTYNYVLNSIGIANSYPMPVAGGIEVGINPFPERTLVISIEVPELTSPVSAFAVGAEASGECYAIKSLHHLDVAGCSVSKEVSEPARYPETGEEMVLCGGVYTGLEDCNELPAGLVICDPSDSIYKYHITDGYIEGCYEGAKPECCP